MSFIRTIYQYCLLSSASVNYKYALQNNWANLGCRKVWISVISVDKTKLKNLRRFNKSWYCDMLANIYIWTTLSRPWAENFESLLVFWWTKNPTTVQPRLRRTQQNYPGKRSRRDTFTSLKKRTCTTHIPQPFFSHKSKKGKNPC